LESAFLRHEIGKYAHGCGAGVCAVQNPPESEGVIRHDQSSAANDAEALTEKEWISLLFGIEERGIRGISIKFRQDATWRCPSFGCDLPKPGSGWLSYSTPFSGNLTFVYS
jgi:hypothetical protein